MWLRRNLGDVVRACRLAAFGRDSRLCIEYSFCDGVLFQLRCSVGFVFCGGLFSGAASQATYVAWGCGLILSCGRFALQVWSVGLQRSFEWQCGCGGGGLLLKGVACVTNPPSPSATASFVKGSQRPVVNARTAFGVLTAFGALRPRAHRLLKPAPHLIGRQVQKSESYPIR